VPTSNYADYLQVDTLLSLQEPKTSGVADDTVVLAEHFFIVAHQSSELWLKQIIFDLEAAAAKLENPKDAGDFELAAELLQRAAELFRVLHEQLLALEKLPLRHFVEFRPHLGTASGAQSRQFRRLATLLGDRRQEGRLAASMKAAAARDGLSLAEVCITGARAGVHHRLVEGLLDMGNAYWRWKIGHLGLVSKMVGEQEGTGGTRGLRYLAERAVLPFAELRRLRSEVHRGRTPPAQHPGSVTHG
jgi:tryptophan 2,3-dioxygenase